MARVDRIVQRQTQREELLNLKALLKASKPLIEADKTLRKAYMAGYQARLKEEAQEQYGKGVETLLKQPLEPCDHPSSQGSTQPDEQPPVGAVASDDGMHL